MTKSALPENKAPAVRQTPSSPRTEHRKSEKESKLPGSVARRQLRMQPQPCKHCAASARRKNCRNSFWNSRIEAFDEFLETRFFAQRIKPLVDLDAAEQALQQNIALDETLLEQAQRFFLLAKCEMNDRERIGADVPLRRKSSQLIEDLARLCHATSLGISVREHG